MRSSNALRVAVASGSGVVEIVASRSLRERKLNSRKWV